MFILWTIISTFYFFYVLLLVLHWYSTIVGNIILRVPERIESMYTPAILQWYMDDGIGGRWCHLFQIDWKSETDDLESSTSIYIVLFYLYLETDFTLRIQYKSIEYCVKRLQRVENMEFFKVCSIYFDNFYSFVVPPLSLVPVSNISSIMYRTH